MWVASSVKQQACRPPSQPTVWRQHDANRSPKAVPPCLPPIRRASLPHAPPNRPTQRQPTDAANHRDLARAGDSAPGGTGARLGGALHGCISTKASTVCEGCGGRERRGEDGQQGESTGGREQSALYWPGKGSLHNAGSTGQCCEACERRGELTNHLSTSRLGVHLLKKKGGWRQG